MIYNTSKPWIVSRVQLPKCRLWIYYGGFNEPIQLGIQAPQAPKKFWNMTNYRDILKPYGLDISYDKKLSISPSLLHPKALRYMNIHPIVNHTPSPPVIRSDLIRRRNFRFPFPMKNVFTPRIYFNAYLTGAIQILSSSVSNHSDHEVQMRCMF